VSETGSGGFLIAPARFPGRAPIDAYGNGGFRFADMSHRGSILALPGGIEEWPGGDAGIVDMTSLARVLEDPGIDILLIGTGDATVPLSPDMKAKMNAAGLWPDVMSTGAAVRTYNVLLSEGRSVAAALMAVGSNR
jgi:uncharacterized protein